MAGDGKTLQRIVNGCIFALPLAISPTHRKSLKLWLLHSIGWCLDKLAKVGWTAPPVDAIESPNGSASSCCKMLACTDERDAYGFPLVAGDEAAVCLRPEPRPERRQWAVAHELGGAFRAASFRGARRRPDEATPSGRTIGACVCRTIVAAAGVARCARARHATGMYCC